MGPVSATIMIDAPRVRVFELVSDLANRPAFCDHFQREFHLERLVSTGVGAAARFRVDAPRFPIWMETALEVIEPDHRLIERGRGGRANRMPVGYAWELVESAGATTEVTWSFWTDPEHLVDRVREHLGAERWYRRQLARALRRLREVAEGSTPLEPLRVAGASRV